MWMVRVALNRPYTFVVLALLILGIGPMTIARTPTDIFPNIDIPVISVVWTYNGLNTEEICRSLGADSLGYISLDGLVEATTVPMDRLCRACFDGVYPVALPDPEQLGKHLLEDPLRTDADGLATVSGGAGAADALSRP